MFIEGQEILDKRYRVIKKLGGGAFGEIYKGIKNTFENLTLCFSREEKVERAVSGQSGKSLFLFFGGR